MPIAQHQWGLATLESASTLMSISANSSATSLQLDNPLRIRYKLKILQNICNSISNSYPIIDLCLSIKKGSIIAWMLGGALGTADGNKLGIYERTQLGDLITPKVCLVWSWRYQTRLISTESQKSNLVVYLCFLGEKSSMDGEVLGFTLGTGYGIKLALNESTDLGSLIGSSEWSGTDLIQGLSIWSKIVNIIFCIIHLSITLINWFFCPNQGRICFYFCEHFCHFFCKVSAKWEPTQKRM